MIIRKKDAKDLNKLGVKMRIYNSEPASVVLQETKKGHAEEFYHDKCTFIYYIIEGEGSYFINSKEHKVKSGDLVIIKPGNKIYYKGNLKQLLINVPPYNAKYEHHVRDIKI
jgi:mannose-6-phosphate isomerase-like protein (cupin superfamily)